MTAQLVIASVVSLLGLRMLWVGASGGRLVEAWVGLFFVATGVGGELSLRAIAPGTEPALAMRWMTVGACVLTVATVSGFAFTYTVFRRGEAWALGVVILGVGLAAWGTFSQLGGSSLQPDTSSLCVQFLIGRIACFAWGTYEGLRAHRMARKRLALGLADPAVTNRFLLFGTWFGAMGVMPVVFLLTRLSGGGAGLELATLIGPKVVGAVMVIALVLTFFPPRRYLAWVASKARTA